MSQSGTVNGQVPAVDKFSATGRTLPACVSGRRASVGAEEREAATLLSFTESARLELLQAGVHLCVRVS